MGNHLFRAFPIGFLSIIKIIYQPDGVSVLPSLVATLFMDDATKRFQSPPRRALVEWLKMRDLWRLMERNATSQTALRGAWSEIVERREAWQGADGTWLDGGEAAWLDLARAGSWMLARRMRLAL